MKKELLSLILLAGAFSVSAETCTVTFENYREITLPVVKKIADQVRGLSGNNTDPGLIMAWDTAEFRAVWMRNTYSPLTAVFIGPDGVIQSIQDMQPNSDTVHSSLYPTIAIIELRPEMKKRFKFSRGEKVISSQCFPLPENL